MGKQGRLLLVLSCVLFYLFIGGAGKQTRGQDRKEKESITGWQILPRLGVSLEYGGFAHHDDVFTSMLRRRIELDVLQYRRFILYLEFDEETTFGTPSDDWEFNRLRHRINLIGMRYDLGEYYLGLLYHHQCNNPIYTHGFTSIIDRARANLYLVGLEFLTKTMRLGMKDRGINFDSPNNFEYLGRWHGAASINKVMVEENIDLDGTLKAQVRYDICRYRRLVPYVEVGGELLAGPVWRLSPTVEVGTRFHIYQMDFTPFLKWGRNQESITVASHPLETRYVAQDYIYGGARLEFLLDENSRALGQGRGKLQLFPEVHGMAGYGLHLRSQYFKGLGNLELDFEALRWEPWTLFVYTDLNLDSRKQDFKPDKVVYNLQYGLTYTCGRYFVEGLVEHKKRLDASKYTDVSERAHLAGLRFGTQGMKPGHYNDGISFNGPDKFLWLNNWNAQVKMGHFFQNRDWQYLWNLTPQIRWDVCRWYFMVPYLQGDLNWLSGGGRTEDALEYAMESGVRFHGVFDLALYYRFQHRENVRYFRGPAENQSLFGIKALF